MNAWKTVLLCTLLAMVPHRCLRRQRTKLHKWSSALWREMICSNVPWNGNGTALDSLCRMIKPETLDKGSVKVDGYSDTKKLR